MHKHFNKKFKSLIEVFSRGAPGRYGVEKETVKFQSGRTYSFYRVWVEYQLEHESKLVPSTPDECRMYLISICLRGNSKQRRQTRRAVVRALNEAAKQ